IRVAFPATTPVERIVNAAEWILPTEAQRNGIVLPKANVGKADGPQRWHVKCAGSAQAGNAQRVVVTVFGGPLVWVDQTRRHLLQIEIDDRVGTNDHCI